MASPGLGNLKAVSSRDVERLWPATLPPFFIQISRFYGFDHVEVSDFPYHGQLAVYPAMASPKQIVIHAVVDGFIFSEAMIHFWFRWLGMLGSPNLKVMKGTYCL